MSESWSLSHNLLFLFVGAMLCFLMIHYALSPPAPKSNKGMHTSSIPASDPILPQHGMQRTANTLGLKVTAESKKNHIKKSCVVDKYRRMAG